MNSRPNTLSIIQLKLIESSPGIKGYCRKVFHSMERPVANLRMAEKESYSIYVSDILNKISDAVIITDLQFRIQKWNFGAEKLYGWSEEEVKDKELINIVPTSYLENNREDVLSFFWKDGYWNGEVLQSNKRGDKLYVAASINLIRDDAGEPKLVCGVNRNITDLKIVQNSRNHKQKLESIGKLAAGIAHEINNPMGFIKSNFIQLEKYIDKLAGILKMVEEEAEKEDIQRKKMQIHYNFIMEDMKSIFKENFQGIERIIDITTRVNNFSYFDSGNNAFETNFNKIVEHAATFAVNEMESDVCIEKHLQTLPYINCDVWAINKVFLNIIINAYEAIKDSGKKGKIIIRTYKKEQSVCCEIEDNGLGMPPGRLKRIFDPFFTTKPVGMGMGLGLHISYDIVVNKHKGEIQVKSVEGNGSVFTVKLPVTKVK